MACYELDIASRLTDEYNDEYIYQENVYIRKYNELPINVEFCEMIEEAQEFIKQTMKDAAFDARIAWEEAYDNCSDEYSGLIEMEDKFRNEYKRLVEKAQWWDSQWGKYCPIGSSDNDADEYDDDEYDDLGCGIFCF